MSDDRYRRTDELVADEAGLLHLLACHSWHEFSGLLDAAWYWDDYLDCESHGSDEELELAIWGEAGMVSMLQQRYPFTLREFWEAIDECEKEYDNLVRAHRLPDPDLYDAGGPETTSALAVFFGGDAESYVEWVPAEANL